MFIYKNFQQFIEILRFILKFSFVYEQWSVYFDFQCLFIFFVICFEKIPENNVKFVEILGFILKFPFVYKR